MTTIPEPLTKFLATERRELLQEAGAMARQLENLARSLHKVAETGEASALHTFAWHMESLAGQGMTAKALARSASDLARQESLVDALVRDANKATPIGDIVTDDKVIKQIMLSAADAGDSELVKLCKRAIGKRPEDADPEARALLAARFKFFGALAQGGQ